MSEFVITKNMTTEQRLAAIKKAANKFNAKMKRETRIVRDYTESYLPKGYPASTGYDDVNVNAWTDGEKYLDEYYGDRVRETKTYDNEWN